MDSVGHSVSNRSSKRIELELWLARLKPLPVLEQLGLVNLSPFLHEAKLSLEPGNLGHVLRLRTRLLGLMWLFYIVWRARTAMGNAARTAIDLNVLQVSDPKSRGLTLNIRSPNLHRSGRVPCSRDFRLVLLDRMPG